MVSEATGIILNNEMDDFSTPGSVNSFLVPPSPANYPGMNDVGFHCLLASFY